MYQEQILKLEKENDLKNLSKGLETFSDQDKKEFLDKIQKFLPFLEEQRLSLKNKDSRKEILGDIFPPSFEEQNDIEFSNSIGLQSLRDGAVACLVLAGGQASRLGSMVPKSIIPISQVMGKSLLQRVCEKTFFASRLAKRPLKIAIMVSELNCTDIANYLEKNNRFGLSRDQVSIFLQPMLPFLDDEGYWILEKPGKISEGPNGNGEAFHEFYKSSIWERFYQDGVRYLNVIPVDNALADPFDLRLIGSHIGNKVDLSFKCVRKKSIQEKVGLVVKENGKIEVLEYINCPDKIRDDIDKFFLASINLYCLTMNFVKKIASNDPQKLNLYCVRKKIPGTDKWVNKFERFIFDNFYLADKTHIVLRPRDITYAPLKNLQGEAGIEEVQKAIISCDRKVFNYYTGQNVDDKIFELEQSFYYLDQNLMGRKMPGTNYVIPEELL